MQYSEATEIVKNAAQTDDLLLAMESFQEALDEDEADMLYSNRELLAYRVLFAGFREMFYGDE